MADFMENNDSTFRDFQADGGEVLKILAIEEPRLEYVASRLGEMSMNIEKLPREGRIFHVKRDKDPSTL